MTNGLRPPLPAALASIKERTQGLTPDQRSFCTLHGVQEAGFCAACDEHFPDLVAARSIAASQPTGFSLEQVDAMVKDAVANAMKEYDAFARWKQSTEGQAAAAAAKTAGVTPPDHSTQPGDVPSGPVAPSAAEAPAGPTRIDSWPLPCW